MDDKLQELKEAQKDLLTEIRYLAQDLREHMDIEQDEREELKVSLARLETKVAIHDKGLGALGAMIIAAISGLVTQFLFRWIK